MFQPLKSLVITAIVILHVTTVAAATNPSATAVAASIGVTPESLVATGIATSSCAEALAILVRIDQAPDLRADLASARSEVDLAGQTLTQIAAALLASPVDEALSQAYEQAATELEAAQEALANAQSELIASALDGVDPSKISQFLVFRLTSGLQVPAAFRVLENPVEFWHEVERALRAEQRAIRLGEVLGEQHAQLLGDIRQDLDVTQAQYNLDAHLASVQQVFDQFQGE